MDSNSSARGGSWMLLILLALVWGSSFILMKRGLLAYTPVQIGCLRMTCAALVMSPFLIRGYKSVQPWQWKYLVITGLFGNAIPSILFPLAESGLSSALAGMINALTPVFTLLLGAVVFGTIVSRQRIIGLSLGFIGAVLLILGGNGVLSADAPVFPLYVVLATVCYAISVNVLRHKLSGLDPLTITAFALLFIGMPMSVILFTTDFIAQSSAHWNHVSVDPVFPVAVPDTVMSFSAVMLLGVFGTALSTVVFNRIIQRSGALVASSVTYLIPVVATCWGFADGEVLGAFHLMGLGLILGGVYLINKSS